MDHKKNLGRAKRGMERNLQFFKVMIGAFGYLLSIPPAFVKYVKEDISEAFLECPNGRLWHVTLQRSPGKLYLHNGWEGFAKDHCLLMGDFLVFRYNGADKFTVEIFGRAACPKNDVCMASVPGPSIHRYGGHVNKKMKDVKWSVTTKVDLRRQPQLDEAKERDGKKFFHTYTSKFPYFCAQLKKSSIGHGSLTIPTVFCKKHFPEARVQILLQSPDGTLWETKYVLNCTSGRFQGRLSGGWSAFAKHHKLDVGDFCAFELVDRYKLRAHIFYKDGSDSI